MDPHKRQAIMCKKIKKQDLVFVPLQNLHVNCLGMGVEIYMLIDLV